jgi:hypothetical protein
MSTYEVEDYSVSNLGLLLDRYSHQAMGYSQGKSHLSYLDDYLSFLGATAILVEHPYTDRDYLEDYVAYYARCHASYERRCARLHFFSSKLGQDVIAKVIASDDAAIQLLKSSYLGFIVVRPLPSTVIGRSCLVTYGNKVRERAFPPARIYKVHILGIELSVSSLPFQEQDTDVAACATSALWSVFNATGHLFQHSIPSPAEITKAAAASQRAVSRTLPALNGLSAEQIADAIRSVGLEPLYIGVTNLDLLLVSASAYLRARIPPLLLGAIIEAIPSTTAREVGLHAIALAGFSVPKGPPRPYIGTNGTLFSAGSIIRLYAHDDQVGPFSRIVVDPAASRPLLTSWPDQNGIRGHTFFDPKILLVPLYHKIRVPVASVISTIVSLDEWLEPARLAKIIPLAERLEWDLALIEIADLKAEVHGDRTIIEGFRMSALRDDMPRYIWRVGASSGASKQFTLLVDATDLLQGGHVAGVLPYSRDTCLAVAALAKNPAVSNYIKSTGNRALEMIVKWFADHTASI